MVGIIQYILNERLSFPHPFEMQVQSNYEHTWESLDLRFQCDTK